MVEIGGGREDAGMGGGRKEEGGWGGWGKTAG